MPDISIPHDDGAMRAYLAVPGRGNGGSQPPAGSSGPWPGVVVVHDALGMTTDLRRQADWLASIGYLAIAPDLYSRGGRLRCLFATMKAFTAGEGPAFGDLDAAHDFLVRRDDCSGRVGVIGFCMGGGFALLLATTGDYGAASVNYGIMPDDALDQLARACPIVASYGGKDRTLRKTPAELEQALTAHDIDHDVATYAEAGHGFLNDHVPGETPLWALVAGSFAATGYHEVSARDARRRIAAFFAMHLHP